MAQATNELEAFVKDALQHASKQQIETVLLEAGWPGDQVRSALELFADNKNFRVFVLSKHGLVQDAQTGDAQDHTDIKREITRARSVAGPA